MDQPIKRTIDAPPVRTRTARQSISVPQQSALLVGLLLMLSSVLLRLPTAGYTGTPDQNGFNAYIFQYIGAYSDITSLYFRDQLWNHPVPYFGYALEYPVGMGILIWLVGFINTGVMPYFLATALIMIVCGVAVFRLGEHFAGANLWLLALSPTLPLYTVLNWDWFGILPTVAALLCFRRNRDGWGAVLLAAAVWIKFFPIVLVPLVLLDRVLRRRWREVWRISTIFALASAVINAPFGIEFADGGVRLRDAWLHFFRFNQQRNRELNFWNLFDFLQLSLDQINRANAVLLALGVGVLMLLMVWSYGRAWRRPQDVLLAASLAAIAWFFFINKVYSPQYSLWVVVLMALLAAPPALAAAFAAVDIGWFAVSFIWLYLWTSANPATDWFYREAMSRSMVLREAVIAAVIGWAIWRMMNNYQLPTPNGHPHGQTEETLSP
jgi:uncharacterized membrane protein